MDPLKSKLKLQLFHHWTLETQEKISYKDSKILITIEIWFLKYYLDITT